VEDQVTTWYWPLQYLHLLRVSPKLAGWINRNISCYDIVHIHGLYRFPTTYAAWRARRAQVPYVVSPHGCLDPFLYKQSRYSLVLKRMYERLLEFPNLNHAAAIHYTAEEEKDRAASLKLGAKTVIVPNGIDWDCFQELPPKGGFRRRAGIAGDVPLVLFLGRINFKKGLDLLVSAFRLVLDKTPEARLAVVGPDNEGYGSKVRLWCAEKGMSNEVVFIDHLEFEAVKEAYVDADVFVLSSYTENFGMTVVEAMACSCPVVISDQVNIWREIKEAGAGLVVGLDADELATAIRRVLSNKDEAVAMGRRGRKVAAERYAWPQIVEQLTQAYQELIDEAARRRRG